MNAIRTLLGCSIVFAAIVAGCDDAAIREAEDRGRSAREAATAAPAITATATATATAEAPLTIDKSDLGVFKGLPAKYESPANPITGQFPARYRTTKRGTCTLHWGPDHDAHLLVPVVP